MNPITSTDARVARQGQVPLICSREAASANGRAASGADVDLPRQRPAAGSKFSFDCVHATQSIFLTKKSLPNTYELFVRLRKGMRNAG